MKTLYFDCSSGISGDMTLGALLDLGIDKEKFVEELSKINVDGYDVVFGKAVKNGIGANKVDVVITLDGYDEDGHPVDHEHHHDHDHEEHEHHHEHDGNCTCGCHDHHHGHEGHHHADEVFTSWGKETAHKYTEEELDYLLKALSETDAYGTVLRSKGIIQMADGSWKQFDMVPEEYEVREGQADYTGRVCVIGTDLKEDDLVKLFHI